MSKPGFQNEFFHIDLHHNIYLHAAVSLSAQTVQDAGREKKVVDNEMPLPASLMFVCLNYYHSYL